MPATINVPAAKIDGFFADLEDSTKFCEIVRAHFGTTPSDIANHVRCTTALDPARIEYAHGEYLQDISKFAVLLQSKNPDHYKRAGALLHAVYTSNVITSLDFNRDDLMAFEAGFSRYSYGDEQYTLKFVQFFDQFHNELLSFDLAYRACSSYERAPRPVDFDYLHNVCTYLKKNPTINVDTCFILFKSLMK